MDTVELGSATESPHVSAEPKAENESQGESRTVSPPRANGKRGLGSVYQRGDTWWLVWYHKGERFRESSKSSDRSVAVKLLKKRIGRAAEGYKPAPDVSRTTFDDLADMLVQDYEANGNRSLKRVRAALGHLREAFGNWQAGAITADEIVKYKNARLKAGAKPATVNREQAALKRAFNLGLDSRKVVEVPTIKMLKENNVRTGYMDEADLDRLIEHLPNYLHNLITVAFYCGWRVDSELLSRERRHVKDGWLVLEPGEGKTRKARQFPITMIPRLNAAITDQLERVAAMEKSMGRVIPWLFVGPTGERIKSFRTAWKNARVKAGLPNAIPHDFRRVAVRALNSAGVSISSAMAMVGHKTISIYQRYSIVDEGDLIAGGEKLAAYYAKREASAQKVIPLKTGTDK